MSNFSSSRTQRLNSSRYLRGKCSKSPTLTSSRSQRSLWARSYKNEPIPTIIGRRLIGNKYNLDNNSDEDQKIIAVQQEEQQEFIESKKRRLPVFKVISDYDEFSEHRKGRIRSERKRGYSSQRCKSVESLKLPQVEEYEKQDDELRKKKVTKLTAVKDNNEFGQRRVRRSSSSYTEVVSRVESLQVAQYTGGFTEQIEENEAEQTKSVKLPNQKSIITSELEKLIVDELDERKKKKEEVYKQQIESIIEEQKHEEEVDTEKLRFSLQKFEEQSEYLQNLNDDEHESEVKGNMRYSAASDKSADIVHEEERESEGSKISEKDDQ